MILDTNALSALADGNPKVVSIVEQSQEISIPTIVLGEYRFGIAQSRHRKEYEGWLSGLLQIVEICDVTHATAIHYADIRSELKRAGTPIPANDLWIAAVCRERNRSLVSKDRDFDSVKNLQRLDW